MSDGRTRARVARGVKVLESYLKLWTAERSDVRSIGWLGLTLSLFRGAFSPLF